MSVIALLLYEIGQLIDFLINKRRTCHAGN